MTSSTSHAPPQTSPHITTSHLAPNVIFDLLHTDPDCPYQGMPCQTPEAIRALSHTWSQTNWLVLQQQEHVQAFVAPKDATWDTQMTGIPCGKLHHLTTSPHVSHGALVALVKAAVGTLTSQGIRHITTRVQGTGPKSHALQEAGFQVYDGLLHLGCHTQRTALPISLPPHYRIERFQETDLSALQRDVAPSFHLSRFHTDPAFANERADALHQAWIANLTLHQRADVTWVAKHKGTPVGFVSLGLQQDTQAFVPPKGIGSIELIAVARHAQQQGIGRALTAHAVQWAASQSIPYLHIATQLWNTPALRTYTACGFQHLSTQLTFRFFRDSV